MWHTAYVALGSNLGDRGAAIDDAIRRLTRRGNDGVSFVVAEGPVLETEPVGCPPGSPTFLNSVVAVKTSLSPRDLLDQLHAIENDLGRVRGLVRNEPRHIDLDLLLFDHLVLDSPDLTLPHPRLHERRFALEPLAAIAADFVHPTLHRTILELLNALPDPTHDGHDNVRGAR